jgi:hypothetical protein
MGSYLKNSSPTSQRQAISHILMTTDDDDGDDMFIRSHFLLFIGDWFQDPLVYKNPPVLKFVM